MGYKEEIYNHSPIFLQNIMTSAMGYLQNRSRYGKEYYEYLGFLEKFRTFSFEEKKQYQFEAFKELVLYAYENSSFYRKLYEGININEMKSFDDVSVLPFVDKEMLRSHIDEVYTVPSAGSVEGHTGGTTGKSLIVRFTEKDFMRRMASLDYFKAQAGFENIKMPKATFNGKSIVPPGQKSKVFWRYNKASNQMIYSSFDITRENLRYYAESLNEFKPAAIDGFFMAICDVAGYMERNGIKPEFTPKAVFPTSETVTETGRALIERVFGCKVYNQYASSEGAPFVTECREGKLHMNMDSGYIEHISHETDEIAVTSFTTHGTPLIRYKIGDSMVFSDETDCGCENESVIVKAIEGRKTDYLYAASGAKISAANVSNIFKNTGNVIIQSQLIQNKKGSIEMNLAVDSKKYTKACEKEIRNEFYLRFGRDTELVINYVDSVPRASSGKQRLVINNIDEV